MAPWRRFSGRLAPQSAQVRIRTAYRRAGLCGRGDSRDVGGHDTEVTCGYTGNSGATDTVVTAMQRRFESLKR